MTDPRAPHICVMNIQMEIHELKHTGECSGKIVGSKELEDNKLKPKFLLQIKGANREECLKKVKEMIGVS